MTQALLVGGTGFIADEPQTASPVAPNFERFDGLTPLDQPVHDNPYGAANPRPGGGGTPSDRVYTRGPLAGVVGTLGGQPIPAKCGVYKHEGDYTPSSNIGVQFRLGVGQGYQGVAQTVALSEITSNPPEPGDLTSILAGLA